ncbi:MAG: hypothetical protein IPM64_00855 [Phycisphaerales bacterium]|nr:hypothetical protein [Phycisphaerales bacterium]
MALKTRDGTERPLLAPAADRADHGGMDHRRVSRDAANRLQPCRVAAFAILGALLFVAGGSSGCAESPAGDPGGASARAAGASPILVRIGRTYPDCSAGRFLVLADFETPDQPPMFRILARGEEPPAGREPSLSILRNRRETGAGGLQATLRSADEQLVFDGTLGDKRSLIRDWSGRHLLLMSAYGPEGGAPLSVSVHSGTDRPATWSATLPLRAGWNTLRIDLDELAHVVDLSDVRRIAWSCPAGPLELYLDDLIITDNTRFERGEGAAGGELLLYSRGRRLACGVGERFEVALRDGVISGIFAEAGSALTPPGGGGPLIVPLPEGWTALRERPPAPDDPRLFESWGGAIQGSQGVVESSAVRLVMQGARRYGAAPGEPGGSAESGAEDRAARSQVRLTVYADGRVFVRLRMDPGGREWPLARAGHALLVDQRSGLRPVPVAAADAARRVHFARLGRDRGDLLWIPHLPSDAAQRLDLESIDEREAAVLIGDRAAQGVIESAHLLMLWPHDLDGAPEGESFAADYQQPGRVEVTTGALRTDVDGDLNGDGYNESEGCHELELAGHVARWRYDPAGRLRHRSIFRVHGTAGRTAWVYVDGRILSEQWRDASGTLMFALPRVRDGIPRIEVNCGENRSPATGS